MSLRYLLKRGLCKYVLVQGCQQNCSKLLTKRNQFEFLRSIEPFLLKLNKPVQTNWRSVTGQGGTVLAVCAAAILQLGSDSEKKEEDSELVKSIKYAVLSLQKGEPEKAERLLHISLRMAQEQANIPAITYIYDLMANIAFEQCNFSKAERLLGELLRRLSADATDSNAFIEVSLKLASVFASSGDAERAEAGFEFCIDTQQRKIAAAGGEAAVDADTLGLWGMSVDWYARFLRSRGQYTRARQLTAQALAACVRVSGERGEQSVVLLSDLGTLDLLCGDAEDAAEKLERAVRLAEELALPELATIQVNLGMCRLQQGMKREAQRSCGAARRLAVRNGDTEAQEMADECLQKVKKLA